jgi:hypothetical protein
MKKLYLNTAIVVIVFLFAIMFIFIRRDKGVKEFDRTFGLELPEGTISEKLYDNYTGFPYEGMRLYRFIFTAQGERQFISNATSNAKWNVLPLTEIMEVLMYGGMIEDRNYSFRFAEKVGLPRITNGYWKVVSDNLIETTKLKDLENIRSFEFSLAIYDINNGVLYMFKINT